MAPDDPSASGTPAAAPMPISVKAFERMFTPLPYSLMMGLMPSESHGAAADLYGFSGGVGLVLGPLVAGVAIELAEPVLESTQGYATVFGVVAAAILLSIPFVRKIDPGATAEQTA